MAIEQSQKEQPVDVVKPLFIGLSFVLPPASSKTLPLAIANRGDKAVNWKADVQGAQWLKLDRYSGYTRAHEGQTLYVIANSGSLQPGIRHRATVILTPQEQGVNPAEIQVELLVSLSANNDGGPHIAIVDPIPQARLAGPQNGKNTTSWQITNPESNGEVTWTINAGGVDWVTSIEPHQGTLAGGEQKTVVVTTDSTLAPGAGTYRTDLVVTLTFKQNNDKREPSLVHIPLTITVP